MKNLQIIGHTYFAGHPARPTRETLLAVEGDTVRVKNARVDFPSTLLLSVWERTRYRTLRDLQEAWMKRSDAAAPPPPAPPQKSERTVRRAFPSELREEARKLIREKASRLTREERLSLGYIEKDEK
jgi:hypothetical protein